MKETKIIAKAANFTATDFGKMSEIKDYTLEMGPEIKIPGKVFGGHLGVRWLPGGNYCEGMGERKMKR